jgi:hypothetical protein
LPAAVSATTIGALELLLPHPDRPRVSRALNPENNTTDAKRFITDL